MGWVTLKRAISSFVKPRYIRQAAGPIASFTLRDGVAAYSLRAQSGAAGVPWGGPDAGERWDLRLSRTAPLRLSLDTGVGMASADLSELQVNGGVGRIVLTLPRQGQLQGSINSGVGQLQIIVPQGVAACIEINRGLGRVQVPADYTRRGNLYQSPDYAESEHRVELTLNGGAGGITISEGGD